MRFLLLLCTITAIIFLQGCGRRAGETRSSPIAAAPPREYKTNTNLPGSNVPLARAVQQASWILLVEAMAGPGVGVEEEHGFAGHSGRFRVIEVLWGEANDTEVQVTYGVAYLRPFLERPPRQNERVIVFFQRWKEAAKMLPGTEQSKKEVVSAISRIKKRP